MVLVCLYVTFLGARTQTICDIECHLLELCCARVYALKQTYNVCHAKTYRLEIVRSWFIYL